jgi:hypothetical protein
LNNFPAMAKGGRRGVTWCISYQSEGSFALEARVPYRSRAHLPRFSYVSLYGAVPLFCNLCTACVITSVDTVVMLVSIVSVKNTLVCGHDV